MFWIDRHLRFCVYLLTDTRTPPPRRPRPHDPPIHKYTPVNLLLEPTHNNATSKSLQNHFVLFVYY